MNISDKGKHGITGGRGVRLEGAGEGGEEECGVMRSEGGKGEEKMEGKGRGRREESWGKGIRTGGGEVEQGVMMKGRGKGEKGRRVSGGLIKGRG